MSTIASEITTLAIVYSTVYLGADQRKHQSSVSLAFVRGIHRGPVNSPHKWPVARTMFPFDDVIMSTTVWNDGFIMSDIVFVCSTVNVGFLLPGGTQGLYWCERGGYGSSSSNWDADHTGVYAATIHCQPTFSLRYQRQAVWGCPLHGSCCQTPNGIINAATIGVYPAMISLNI